MASARGARKQPPVLEVECGLVVAASGLAEMLPHGEHLGAGARQLELARQRGLAAERAGAEQRRGPRPIGRLEEQQLDERAAERHPDEVVAVDAEAVEDCQRVAGELGIGYDRSAKARVERPVSRWSYRMTQWCWANRATSASGQVMPGAFAPMTSRSAGRRSQAS
jgi:hypothetical protein